jgi:hypothetical protein
MTTERNLTDKPLATVVVDGVRIAIEQGTTTNGEHFLHLVPLNGDLEGEEPGLYFPKLHDGATPAPAERPAAILENATDLTAYAYEGGREDAYVDTIADLLLAAHAEGLNLDKVTALVDLHVTEELA